MEISGITTNGQPADILISDNSNIANSIIWNENNVVFQISGFLNTEELVALAESIEEAP